MNKGMMFQVECTTRDVVKMCVEEYGWSMEKALDELYASETFRMLEDERSGLYYQSPAYVFGCLSREFATGKMG